MPDSDKNAPVRTAVICSILLMLFSFFISFDFPLRLLAFGALIAVAVIISRELKLWSDISKITGKIDHYGKFIFFLVLGIIAGSALSVFYRWHLDAVFFPGSLSRFAIIAAMIGSAEELIFRGYIQEKVRIKGGLFSVVFSSVAHTGYKCCLFLSPIIVPTVSIGFLAVWTFTAGMLAGSLRHSSRSVWPSLAAHAIFDILVYGEAMHAPWWVW